LTPHQTQPYDSCGYRRSAGPKAASTKKMSETLLKKLEQLNKTHIDEGAAVMKAFGGAMYTFDLLTLGVLNRSMSLTSGFVALMRLDNYLAATTLVRPQLDSFLRYAAGWLVADPHEFAMETLRGTPIKKQKAADGHLMTDRFLVDHFKGEYPWLQRVYDETSGLVHLSKKHMLMYVTETDAETGTATFWISDRHTHVPPKFRREAIRGFTEITTLILHRAYSWRVTKENPPAPKRPAGQDAS